MNAADLRGFDRQRRQLHHHENRNLLALRVQTSSGFFVETAIKQRRYVWKSVRAFRHGTCCTIISSLKKYQF